MDEEKINNNLTEGGQINQPLEPAVPVQKNDKKAFWISFLITTALLLLITGAVWYFNSKKISGDEKRDSSLSSEGTVVMSGSGSALELLSPLIEKYEESYPAVKIEILTGTETGDGIEGVGEGLLDIGIASRLMKESEKEKYPDLIEISLFKDPLALGVNSNVTIDDLTHSQIKDIYSGEVTNWSEIGGNSKEIVVLDREEEDSSKILIRKYILGSDFKITERAFELHSGSSMHEAIEEMNGAIGYVSVGTVEIQGLSIKSLSINGVEPTGANITNGKYELCRTIGLVTEDKPTEATQHFINFLRSDIARSVIIENKLLPI